MPKSLREPPPSSSVARLLDRQAASRALAASQPTAAATASEQTVVTAVTPRQAVEAVEDSVVKREITLSPETAATLDELVRALRTATGTRLSTSHVVRALLRGLGPNLPFVQLAAQRFGRIRLPSNAPAYSADRERFEQRLAAALLEAIRGASAFQHDSI